MSFLTGALVTDIEHHFRGTFDVSFDSLRLELLDQYAHAAQGGDEVENTNDTEFEEVGSLINEKKTLK